MGGQQGMQGGTTQRAMGGQAMGGQRELPVEPVGVEEVSPEDVVTATPDDPLTEVAEMMAREDVGTVVVTEDQRPIGLVTDRMIAMKLTETPDLSELTAGDVMTEDLVTIDQDDTIFDAIQTLGGSGIRRAPVVDEEGNLAGIVSFDDVIVLLAEELDQVSDIVQQQIDRF